MSLLDKIKAVFSRESPPSEEDRPGGQTSATGHREPTPEEMAAAAAAQPATASVEPVSAEPPAEDVARSAASLDESAAPAATPDRSGEDTPD